MHWNEALFKKGKWSLKQRQGKHHQARNTLSEIYHWFTAGFDTKDLREAKALIEDLNH